MPPLNRREFLALAGAAGISTAIADPVLNAAGDSRPAGDFTFLFLTDTHLQPELKAAEGCAACFKRARSIQSDFAIQGGDHVFDCLAVSHERATSLFDLYAKTEQDL